MPVNIGKLQKVSRRPEINPCVWSLLIKSCGFCWNINEWKSSVIKQLEVCKISHEMAQSCRVSGKRNPVRCDLTTSDFDFPHSLPVLQALTSLFFSFLGLCFISSLFFFLQFAISQIQPPRFRLQLFTRPVFESLAAPFAELSVRVCRGGNSKSLCGILALQLTPPTR